MGSIESSVQRRIVSVLLVATSLVVACSRAADKDGVQERDPQSQATASSAAPSGDEDAPSAPVPGVEGPRKGGGMDLGPSGGEATQESARVLPNVGNCVTQCVERDRMKAVSPEQLDADCANECAQSCLAHCKSGTDTSRKACEADCDRQKSRLR